jgi:peptidylprolyl isomerase
VVKKLTNEILISLGVILICGLILIGSAVFNNSSQQAAIASSMTATPNTTQLTIPQTNQPKETLIAMDTSNATTTDSGSKKEMVQLRKLAKM